VFIVRRCLHRHYYDVDVPVHCATCMACELAEFLIALRDLAALCQRICSVSSRALFRYPSPILCITSKSCSWDYLLVRCTKICSVQKNHCSLYVPVLEIHAHHLTSTVLLSCRRLLPQPPFAISRVTISSALDAFSP